MRVRGLSVGAAASAIVLVAAACSPAGNEDATVADGDWDAVVAAANSEGAVTVYTTGTPTTMERIEQAFEAKFPSIDLTIVRQTSAELAARVEQERSTGVDGADVVMTAGLDHAEKLSEEGLFEPPKGPESKSPAWSDSSLFIDGSYVWSSFDPYGMAYNTDLVTNPPRTYPDLAGRTDLVGKVGSIDLFSPLTVAVYQHIENEVGGDILEDLSGLEPRLFPSVVPLLQAVASGELGFSMFAVVAPLSGLKAEGAPIEFIFCEVGCAGAPNATGALTFATHPNAAQVFLDFVMSPDGQEAITGDGSAASALPDTPGALAGPEVFKPFEELNDLPQSEITEFTQRFNEIFK